MSRRWTKMGSIRGGGRNSPSKAQRNAIPPSPSGSAPMFSGGTPPQSVGSVPPTMGFGAPPEVVEEEPVVDEAWAKKHSRQRRFTKSTRPELHFAAQDVPERSDEDYERDVIIEDMKSQLDEMSGHIGELKLRKEEEEAHRAMFDEDGNPIQQYDEDGNPIPMFDEDGVAWPSESPLRHRGSMVDLRPSFNPEELRITQGWLWKKGKGGGTFGRKNWKRRFFILDHDNPLHLYYFSGPNSNAPKGMVRLDGTVTEQVPPEEQKQHKSSQVKSEFEFTIEHEYRRRFHIFAETRAHMEAWLYTLSYIAQQAAKALEDAEKAHLKKFKLNRLKQRSEEEELMCDEAQNMTAAGPGLFEGVAGQRCEFTIQAVDAAGNEEEFGGRIFSAILESDDLHYDLDVEDNDDGTYSCSYVPTALGEYELSILLNDFDIYGSPFRPAVVPAPVSAAHCLAEGPGLYSAVIGGVNTFTVQARNSFDVVVKGALPPFVIELSPPLALLRTTPNTADGTLTIEYAVNIEDPAERERAIAKATTVAIAVTLDDQLHVPSFPRNVRGSPRDVVICTAPSNDAIQSQQAVAQMHAAARIVANADKKFVERPTATNDTPAPFSVYSAPAPAAASSPLTRTLPDDYSQREAAIQAQLAQALAQQGGGLAAGGGGLYPPSSTPTLVGAGTMSAQGGPALSSFSPGGGTTGFLSGGSAAGIAHQKQQPTSFLATERWGVSSAASFGVGSSPNAAAAGYSHGGVASQRQHNAGFLDPVAGAASGWTERPMASSPLSGLQATSPQQQALMLSRQNAEERASLEERARQIEEERKELLELRRELEQGRNVVDAQVGKMAEMGRAVQANSEKLMDQARLLVERSPVALTQQQRAEQGGFDGGVTPPPPPPPESTEQSPQRRVSPRAVSGRSVTNVTTSSTQRFVSSTSTYLQYQRPQQQRSSPSSRPSRSPPQRPSPARRSPGGRGAAQAGGGRNATVRTFGEGVAELFDRHHAALRRVFEHYATTERSIAQGNSVKMPGFVRLAQDYDITPTFISRKELREAFDAATAGSGSAGFGKFIEALGHVAVNSLSKPMFAHLYTTNAAKVNVLLTMWGVADPLKLSEVHQRG